MRRDRHYGGTVRSGRPGGDRCRELRERPRRAPDQVSRRCGGGKRLVKDILQQAGEVAALSHDDDLQFPPQGVAGQDAEIAADVSDDGADRLAADLGGDLRRCGQMSEAGVGFAGGGRGGWPGRARSGSGRSCPRRCVQAVGVAEEPGFERVGAVQAAGYACEDQRDIGGAEAAPDRRRGR